MKRTAVGLLLALLLAVPAEAGIITISEVLYDSPGSDDGNTFVELFGPAGYTLDGWFLEGVNGSNGSVTHRIDLDGARVPLDGFLVLADRRSSGATSVLDADYLFPSLDLQNGPDSLRLLRGSVVVDALGYGTFGPSDLFFGEGGAAPGTGPGQSLARLWADLDRDRNDLDFRVLDVPTPGTGATLNPVVATPEPATLALFGVGLVALWLCRRRYSRKQKTLPDSVAT